MPFEICYQGYLKDSSSDRAVSFSVTFVPHRSIASHSARLSLRVWKVSGRCGGLAVWPHHAVAPLCNPSFVSVTTLHIFCRAESSYLHKGNAGTLNANDSDNCVLEITATVARLCVRANTDTQPPQPQTDVMEISHNYIRHCETRIFQCCTLQETL